MTVDKLHTRKTVVVLEADHQKDREIICVNDAIGRLSLFTSQVLRSMEIGVGDAITLDLKVLIEHKEDTDNEEKGISCR